MTRSAACAAVLALLLAPLAAAAQSAPSPSPAGGQPAPAGPAAAAASSAFSLSETSERAEDVAGQLRSMTEAISDTDVFGALQSSVTQLAHRVSDRWRLTDRMLAAPLRRAALETLASSWRALRTELIGVRDQVDQRVQQRDADLASLDRLKESWHWTLQQATGTGAPAPVLDRIADTIAAIDATRAQVDARHAQLLVLQDAASRAMQACDDATTRIADARKRAVQQILSVSEPPLWRNLRPFAAPIDRSKLSEASAAFDAVRIYAQAYRWPLLASLALTAVLAWGMVRERRRARRGAFAEGELPDLVAHALRAPIPAALLLGLVITRPLRPDPPTALQNLFFAIGLASSLILLRPVLGPRILTACRAFAGFFAIDVVRLMLRVDPALEQWVLFVEMAAATPVLFWTASILPIATGALVTRSHWVRGTGRVVSLAACATGLASVAAALGYLELADFVGTGALRTIYIAIGLLAFRVAAGGALWFALVRSPLARLRAVTRHRDQLEDRVTRGLEVLSVGIWIVFALQTFELLDPATALAGAALDAKLQAGELSLSVGRVLGFLLVVVIAWLTARIVIFALEEDVYPRMHLARGVPYALSNLVRYALLLAGFIAALATLGLDLTRLTVLVSAFGLGIGFGLQQIFNNFVSGLILLFERPVQVGDQIQMKDLGGEVLRIGIRSSTIRTSEGAEVIVPNADLIQNSVTNWTLSDRRRRVALKLGVAYGTPADQVIALLTDVARSDPRVMPQPGPEALFTGFGASALEFELRFWTEDARWTRLKSDLGVAVQAALREAGIGVPVTPVEVQVEATKAGAGPG